MFQSFENSLFEFNYIYGKKYSFLKNYPVKTLLKTYDNYILWGKIITTKVL